MDVTSTHAPARDFREFWQGLSPSDRESFAGNVGSTVGYCHQIAYGTKRVELGLADAMVASSGGRLTLDVLPLTERAIFQRAARAGQPPVATEKKAA